jgi:predicted dehydrogenase
VGILRVTFTVCIIGLGNIGWGYDRCKPAGSVLSHVRACQQHEDFHLIAAVEPNSAIRQAAQSEIGIPIYANLIDLLQQHHTDVVIVATPTEDHLQTISTLLTHYKPRAILCEKPLAYDIAHSTALVDACNKHNVSLYVNFIRRALPGIQVIQQRIAEKIIAPPIKGIVWYSKGLLHNGSHFVDLLTYWLGPIRTATLISAGRTLSAHDVEPDVHLTFEHGSALFCAADENNFSHYTVELIAANGRLRVETRGDMVWQAITSPENVHGQRFLVEHKETIPFAMDRYQYFVCSELARALGGMTHALCTGEQALTEQRVITSLIAQTQNYGKENHG